MKNPPTLLSEKFNPVTPKKNRAKIIIVAEVISHKLKDTLKKKHVSRYGRFYDFWRFLWAKMAKSNLIDLKIGLSINSNVKGGQNKFEVDISKNVAK